MSHTITRRRGLSNLNPSNSRTLIDKSDIRIAQAKLATEIGLNENIFLQQVHYWLKGNEERDHNYKEGRYWVYNSYGDWVKESFPFWSKSTVKRTVQSLEKQGLIITTSKYNKKDYDKTKWYTIDYEKLKEVEIKAYNLEEDKSEKTTDQNDTPPDQDGTGVEENSKEKSDKPLDSNNGTATGQNDTGGSQNGTTQGQNDTTRGQNGRTNTKDSSLDLPLDLPKNTSNNNSTIFSNLELKLIKEFYQEVTERKLKNHLIEEISNITNDADKVMEAIKRASLNNNTTGTPSAKYIISILKNLEDEQEEKFKYDNESERLEANGWT